MNELEARNNIITLQRFLESSPAVSTNMQEFTDHFFAPGVYLRTLFIPKGHVLVGKEHKHPLINILLKGKIAVVTSWGEKILAEAPYIFLSEPGKKAGYAVSDVWYAGVIPNPDNITDIDQLEEMNIVKEVSPCGQQ